MREPLTRKHLVRLIKELAASAPRRGTYRVYFVGGGTAVYMGWRLSSIDVDLFSDQDVIFRDIQKIKERLNINIVFARPEDFVPLLDGTADRHVFIEKVGAITFYHYDPYAQLFSKVVRGFERDLADASNFVSSGTVDPDQFRALITKIPDTAYARYPSLSRDGVEQAVDRFLSEMKTG